MELFLIIVNGWKPLTIITKSSILDIVSVLGPSLDMIKNIFSFIDVKYKKKHPKIVDDKKIT